MTSPRYKGVSEQHFITLLSGESVEICDGEPSTSVSSGLLKLAQKQVRIENCR